MRSECLNGKVPTAHLPVNGNKIFIFFVRKKKVALIMLIIALQFDVSTSKKKRNE